jgi:hypothetical protein
MELRWISQKKVSLGSREHLITMRSLLPALFAFLTLPAIADIPPTHQTIPQHRIIDTSISLQSEGKAKGEWYMTVDGHAVFCYGPTMMANGPNGSIQKIATFCRGGKTIVPLHE